MNTTIVSFENLPIVVNQLQEIIEQLGKDFRNFINSNASETKKLMDSTDAAAYLKVTEQTVYSYAKSAELPHFKKGKKFYFYESELRLWVETGRVKTRLQMVKEVDNVIAKNAK